MLIRKYIEGIHIDEPEEEGEEEEEEEEVVEDDELLIGITLAPLERLERFSTSKMVLQR